MSLLQVVESIPTKLFARWRNDVGIPKVQLGTQLPELLIETRNEAGKVCVQSQTACLSCLNSCVVRGGVSGQLPVLPYLVPALRAINAATVAAINLACLVLL